jgi:hypothetical protein
MKLYVVINIASQIEGQLMVVKVEKTFPDRDNAEAHLKSLPNQAVETIPTEAGELKCVCQRSVFEIELPGYVLSKEPNMIAPVDQSAVATSVNDRDQERQSRNYKELL